MSFKEIEYPLKRSHWYVFLSATHKWIATGFVAEDGEMQIPGFEGDPTHICDVADADEVKKILEKFGHIDDEATGESTPPPASPHSDLDAT